MKNITLIFFVLYSMFVVAARAQAPTEQTIEWMRVESPSGDLSFAFPVDGNIVLNDGDGYRIWHFEPGLSLSFIMRKVADPKSIFNAERSASAGSTASYYKSGDFYIRQSAPGDAEAERSSESLTLASSKGHYRISASVSKSKRRIYAMFLNSVKVEGSPLFTGKPVPVESRSVRINDLKTSNAVLDAMNRPDPKNLKLQKGTPPAATEIGKTQYSRDLIMLRSPLPKSPQALSRSVALTGLAQHGEVKLRVTLSANGQIASIFLLQSLDNDHDQAAFEAAKKIRFLPAEVDDKPVDVIRDFDYTFTVFH